MRAASIKSLDHWVSELTVPAAGKSAAMKKRGVTPVALARDPAKAAVETALKAGKHVYCQKPLTHDIHEARLLALDPAKAERELGWQPRWTFEQAVNTTVDWYHAVHQGADPVALSLQQIQSFTQS